MNYLDLENNCVIASNCVDKLRTTADDIDGTTVDMLNYRACTFVGMVGAELDTLAANLYIEFNVEESDDDSTYTDVAAADLTTTVTSTSTVTGCFALLNAPGEAPAIHTTTYIGGSRYVRAVILCAGTHTNGTPSSIVSIKHGAKNLPAV